MALSLRCRHLRRITKDWRCFPISGTLSEGCRLNARIFPSSVGALNFMWEDTFTDLSGNAFSAQRFSSAAESSHDSTTETDLVSFLVLTFDQIKGPHHFWLNRTDQSKDVSNKEGIFLLLVDDLLSGYESRVRVQTAKNLQQRYPWLQVFAVQLGSSDSSIQTPLLHHVLKDYITFPILLSTKTFPEMMNRPCYILFKGFKSPQLYYEKEVDLWVLQKDIMDVKEERIEIPGIVDKLKSAWSKQMEPSKEPYISLILQNMLLHYPACISVDRSGGRFFLSDSNHHRIIIFDGNGKILDLIGSSPGFEDGEFENVKLLRPAGSYYRASDSSLYFVDSENHAFRRADMEKRVVETLYPANKEKDKDGLWTWIMTKLGMKRDVDTRSDEFDPQAVMFPWHLIKLEDERHLIMNKSCSHSWIMDLDRGVIDGSAKGSENIMKTYGPQIMEKVSVIENFPISNVESLAKSADVLDNIPYADLLSSVAQSGSRILMCDKVGHRVLAVDLHSGLVSTIQFSNFGTLGLPYWLSSSLEKVYSVNAYAKAESDRIQSFTLLPGRVDIQLNVDIPSTTVLVEPLQEGSVWRQARGAAAVISEEESGASDEKVGVSQQWYDELDNLAFSSDPEVSQEEEKFDADEDEGRLKDDRVHIDCSVNTSPGTCEVIIYAALYLRLKNDSSIRELSLEEKARILANILNPKKSEGLPADESDVFIQLLTNSNSSLEDLIFMKPLHVRIQLNTLDHPKEESSKNIVVTDSSIEVDVSL